MNEVQALVPVYCAHRRCAVRDILTDSDHRTEFVEIARSAVKQPIEDKAILEEVVDVVVAPRSTR